MKKRGKMKARWISILLCMSMLLSDVPVTVFANGETEAASENETQVLTESESESETKVPAESESESETKVPAESESESETKAPVESVSESETKAPAESESESETKAPAESESESESNTGADTECGNHIEETVETEEQDADAAKVAAVQALADALPDVVTLENKEATGNQLNAFIQAYGNLDAALQAQVDLTKYDKTIAAMYELEGMAGAQKVQTLAEGFPEYNASSYGNSMGTCILTPGSTGEEFYNWVYDKILINKNQTFIDYAYITQNQNDTTGGFYWSECKEKTIKDGRYYIYVFVYGININTIIMQQYYVDVQVRYTINIKSSGAPSGYGGVTVNGEKAGSAQYVSEGGSIALSVTEVPGHNYTVNYGDAACTVNGNVYTFNNVNQSFTFSVTYEADEFAEVAFEQPYGATIEVITVKNETKTSSPVEVISGLPYTVKVTAKDGYKLKTVTIDGASQNITNNQSMTFTPTAGSNGTKHTVSATTEEVDLQVKTTASIIYTKEEDITEVAKRIFNAIYTGSDYTASDVGSKIKVEVAAGLSADLWFTLSDWYYLQRTDLPMVLSTGIKDCVTVRLTAGDSSSDACTVDLCDGAVSANGEIKKDYTGQSVQLSSQDFSWTYPANFSSSYALSFRYYDANGTLLDSVPTAVGQYKVRVETVSSIDTGGMIPTSYYTWSDYIPFEIVNVEVQSITDISGDKTYDGQPVVLNYTVTTKGSGEAKNWQFVNGQCDGFLFTPEYAYQSSGAGSFTNGLPTDPGTYTVRISIGNKTATETVTISKLSAEDITVSSIADVTYNGQKHEPTITVTANDLKLVQGTHYTVSYKDNIDAGTAVVTVTGKIWDGTLSKEFQIKKRSLTAAIVDADKVYDGTANAENAKITFNDEVAKEDGITVTADISYADADVAYDNQGQVIGKTVTAKNIVVAGNNKKLENYELTNIEGENAVLTTTATISPRPVTVVATSCGKTYGEADPANFGYVVSETTPLVAGETLEGALVRDKGSEGETGEDVGSYAILQGTLTNENNPNYDISFTSGTFTIGQRELTVIVTVNDKHYDGLADATFAATLKGVQNEEAVTLKDGVTAAFEDAEPGTDKTVTFSKAFELNCTEEVGKNYYLTQPSGLKGSIYYNWEAEEYTVTPTDWTNDVVKISAAEGYLISEGNKADSIWTDELTYAAETVKEGQEVTFYLRNKSTNAISLPETAVYYIDTTVPTGTIAISELEGWNKLLDVITFELFFHEIQTVTIDFDDTLSGVKSVEYYESDKALSLEDLESITDWKTYTESFHVEIEDAKKFIYFAKITDNAGNVNYLSTDGAVYDISAPTVDGIINGGKYNTTQVVTVTDANLAALTLNGEDVTSPFVLEGNKDIIYTILATDKAGNSTTVNVVMQPITVLDDTIEEMKENDVTSDQKDTIQNVLDQVEDLLNDEDLTEDEKTELEEIKKNAETLKNAIDNAKADISTEEISKTDNLDVSNVKLEDKADIEAAKAALEQALKDNAGNYTEAEKAEIQSKIDRLEQAEESVVKTENVIQLITSLPESSNPDMTEAEEEAILAVLEAYQALSDHERSLISEKDGEKLETLMEGLKAYEIIEGDGEKWAKEKDGNLRFVVNGAYRKFVALWIDGKRVDETKYTSEAGGTVVYLKSTYLETLSEGEHTITFEYTDGEVEGTFTVHTAAAETETDTQTAAPATGDETNLILWFGLMGLSILAMAVLLIGKRRKAAK